MRHLHVTAEPKDLRFRAWIPAAVSFIAAVAGLLFWGSPSAVVRGIRSVEVNPINRVISGWFRAHVSEEILKALTPAVANGDAASAISREVLACGVIAAFFHQRPSIPFRRITHAMSAINFSGSLSMQASASLDLSSKMILSNAGLVPAVALTHPSPMSFTDSLRFKKDNQASKALACQIFRCAHMGKLYHKLRMVGVSA